MNLSTLALAAALLFTITSPRAAESTNRFLPFQARLTDAAGKPVPDGAAVVQFQIFGDPTDPTPVWRGELHRVTVNGGLVNVWLGSKNPFPLNRTNASGAVLSFFDATLYLEVTVDSTGKPDGTPDGAITEADPPLLPRQAILPVVFAMESASSRKLAGYDWASLLSTNDPVVGKLSGAKLSDASVGNAQIAPNAIQQSNISAGAITTDKIVAGAITAEKLAEAAMDRVPSASMRSRRRTPPGGTDGAHTGRTS